MVSERARRCLRVAWARRELRSPDRHTTLTATRAMISSPHGIALMLDMKCVYIHLSASALTSECICMPQALPIALKTRSNKKAATAAALHTALHHSRDLRMVFVVDELGIIDFASRIMHYGFTDYALRIMHYSSSGSRSSTSSMRSSKARVTSRGTLIRWLSAVGNKREMSSACRFSRLLVPKGMERRLAIISLV